MTLSPVLLIGFIAALPLFGLILFWRDHHRKRSRALMEALGAIALSVVILITAGAVVGAGTAPIVMFIPVIIGGAAVAGSLNRMVNREPV